MHGAEKRLLNFMQSTKLMIVPVYQRNYDWKLEQCRQLLSDLEDIIQDEREPKHEHFFGSIVSVADKENNSRTIIDGQQRIATVSIMLIALVNLLKAEELQSADKNLAERLSGEYLMDTYDETKKLRLIAGDQSAYDKLFGSDHIEASNITGNYNFFFEQFRHFEIPADDIFNAIKRLSVIDITLDSRNDDPQKIFESLNSTGLDLNEGDKIRNFILMNLTPEQQTKYYDEYWHVIEELTKPRNSFSYDVSDFVKDYLTVKTGKINEEKKIYAAFKTFNNKCKLDREELLKDILKYARYYDAIRSARTGSERVNEILRRLNTLKMTVAIPYFLAVCNLRAEEKIPEDDFVEVFEIIESYIMRRIVCGITSNALDDIFKSLNQKVCKHKVRYVDALKYQIVHLSSIRARFPSDDEFAEKLAEKDVVRMKDGKFFLMARLENDDSLIEKLIDKKCVITRIMPDRLTRKWKVELGANAEEVCERWSSRLANLTVVDAEIKFGGTLFKDKKSKLNPSFGRYSKWTERELLDRNEMLIKRALQLWQYPTTEFQPLIQEKDIHTLEEEDFDFCSNRDILSFTFLGERHGVKNWIEMYKQVLKLAYDLDASRVRLFALDRAGFASKNFVEGIEIDKTLYANKNISNDKKLQTLQELFDYCGLDKEDLEIELRPLPEPLP